MRQVVVGPERINARFLDFTRHHGFEVKCCRPYRPRTKGKVERSVSYLRDSFLNGRTFSGHVRERWQRSVPTAVPPPPKGCHITFTETVQVRPLAV